MITGKTIGKNGRLANQCFQMAFLLAQSEKRGVPVAWPKWEYAQYFEGDFTPVPIGDCTRVVERNFEYDPEFFDGLDWEKNLDFHGYFQSFRYWENEQAIRAAFKFEQSFTERVRAMNAAVFAKPTIAIHLRRGDYAGNPHYINFSAGYYLSALEKHFPDWKEQNLVVFSDDTNYAKLHFSCFENAYFPQGNEIEDLALMSMLDSFIVANSSFSWWAAWLSGSKKVVRPEQHFCGNLAKNKTHDLYPEAWVSHDTERLDLRDTTFLIPVAYDHPDRLQNLELVLQYLIVNFDANFIVCEQGGQHFQSFSQWCEYLQLDSPIFHRTRMLNIMAEMANTPIIVNYDADVLLPPSQILESVHRIRNGANVVYPYSGRFVRLDRKMWYNRLLNSLDVGETAGHTFKPMRRGDTDSKGGCIFFDRAAYFGGGGENERFVSFGHEDEERFHRFKTLGFDVQRVNGNIMHVDHYCGVNSSTRNPAYIENFREWGRVQKMGKEELKKYISFAQVAEFA